MENNVLKENYLEVLHNQDTKKTTESEFLPVVIKDKKLLLPVVIPSKETALAKIKTEISNLKENRALAGLWNFIKKMIKIILGIIRFCIMAVSNVVVFISVSVIIVMSIAIVTKNIVNAYYNIKPQDDYTYSIFKLKE